MRTLGKQVVSKREVISGDLGVCEKKKREEKIGVGAVSWHQQEPTMCYSNSLTFLNYFFLAYTLLLLSIYNMKEGYLDFVMLTD